MRKIPLLLLLVVLGAAVLYAAAVPRSDFYLGGIQVNEPDHERWVRELDRAGLGTVAVTVYAKQGDWDSDNLWFEEEEPWVVSEIRTAKARGLDVVLVLRVALDHAFERNRFFWHGMIMPRTDEMVGEWFDRYRRFAVRWAEIAEREGVDVLAVASEMNSLTNTVPVAELPGLEEYWSDPERVERHEAPLRTMARDVDPARLGLEGEGDLARRLDERAAAHRRWAERIAWLDDPDPVAAINRRRRLLEAGWLSVIDAVREGYSGELTYAANFDQYESVAFWDRLDLIAVNAYFPLRRRLVPEQIGADLEALFRARWTRILGSLDAFRRARGIPRHRVLFTEIGYVRRAHSTLEPWAAHGVSAVPSAGGPRLLVWQEQPEDRHERARAVRALYDAHLALGGDLLAGLLYWKLSTVPAHEDIEPFVLVLGSEAPADPLLPELQRFGSSLSRDRLFLDLRRRTARLLASLVPGLGATLGHRAAP